MGKRTIANAFANSLGVTFQIADASSLCERSDLFAVLSSMCPGGLPLAVKRLLNASSRDRTTFCPITVSRDSEALAGMQDFGECE
jgi:hypothetical protein